jgi:hypothetical protein
MEKNMKPTTAIAHSASALIAMLFNLNLAAANPNQTHRLAGVNGEFRMEIQDAACSEVDPWYVGDACVFKMKFGTELIGVVRDFDAFMTRYRHEDLAGLAGQHVGLKGTDLAALTDPNQLEVLNAEAEGRTYYLLSGTGWLLIKDPAEESLSFQTLTYAYGAESEMGRYPGFEELETFEEFPQLDDGQLVESLQQGTTMSGLSVTQMRQLKLARQAVIHFGGPYGEALANGEYLNDPDTRWQLVEMTNPVNDQPIDVVRFIEKDDGSHSVMFEAGSVKPLYVYYEN